MRTHSGTMYNRAGYILTNKKNFRLIYLSIEIKLFNLTEVLNNIDFSYLSMLENMHDKNGTKQSQHIGNKRRVEVDFRITVETI